MGKHSLEDSFCNVSFDEDGDLVCMGGGSCCPLDQMGLEKEIYNVFKKVEQMALDCCRVCDEEPDRLQSVVDEMMNYIVVEKEIILNSGKYPVELVDEQFFAGILYVGDVGMTGEVPVYDARFD